MIGLRTMAFLGGEDGTNGEARIHFETTESSAGWPRCGHRHAPGPSGRRKVLRRLPRPGSLHLRPIQRRGGLQGRTVRHRPRRLQLPLRRGRPLPGPRMLRHRPRPRLRILRGRAPDLGPRQPALGGEGAAPLRADSAPPTKRWPTTTGRSSSRPG
jgi:hypothetical protein